MKSSEEKSYKTTLFRIYYYGDESAAGKEEGVLVLTNSQHREVSRCHFDHINMIPSNMRRLLKEAASKSK